MATTGGLSNAERIALALDELLVQEVSLVVYGRAAIALGFEDVPDLVKLSLDVDVILRNSQGPALDTNDLFWKAQEVVNEILEKDGLIFSGRIKSSSAPTGKPISFQCCGRRPAG